MTTVSQKNDLVKYETDSGDVTLSVDIVKQYICPKATNAEAFLFMKLCRFQKLNPFLKEVYLIKYSSDDPASMVVGKETFTKRAERHPNFDGYKAGIYVLDGKEEIQKRTGAFYVEGETVIGGWAEVFRKDMEHSFESTVQIAEYIVRKRDGTPNMSWRKRPGTMIRKVALVQALRETFPDQFAGMYIEEEPQDREKIEAEIQMPTPVEKTPEPAKEEDGEEVEGSVEDVPDDVPEPTARQEDEQLELSGDGEEPDYFQLIVKWANSGVETSKILPVMTKANEAKEAGDTAKLKEIYESLGV